MTTRGVRRKRKASTPTSWKCKKKKNSRRKLIPEQFFFAGVLLLN
jgi:hypothetical protein